MTNIKIIGETIQKLRRAAGETQEQLANAVGVSAQAVSKWENGGVPDIELLPQIAGHYGVTVDTLFGNDLSDTAGLKQAFLKTFAETPNDEWIDKVFEHLFDIERTAFGEYDGKNTMSEAIGSHSNSSVSFKGGFTHMGLDKLRYFLLVPNAADWDDALFGPDLQNGDDDFDYPALFKDLSDPDVFRILLEMHRRDNSKQFTPSLFVRSFGMTPEKADEIVRTLKKYRFMSTQNVDLDGESIELLTFHSNLCFVALLIFARQIISRPLSWYGYIGNSQNAVMPKTESAESSKKPKVASSGKTTDPDKVNPEK